MRLMAEFRSLEPRGRELLSAVRHVLSSENAQSEHLHRREVRYEGLVKILACRLGPHVLVPGLHQVVNHDELILHGESSLFTLDSHFASRKRRSNAGAAKDCKKEKEKFGRL
jgi:hypothetical protein